MSHAPSTVVRTAQARDAAELAVLFGQLGYPQGALGLDQRIERLADTATDAVLVAEVDGGVVGVVSLHVTPFFNEGTSRGRITSLVVGEDRRGQGIGRALLDAAEEAARRRGCYAIELTSGAHRRDAHRFYLAAGYEVQPHRFRKSLS